MRRIIALLLVVLTLGAVAAGCGSTSKSAGKLAGAVVAHHVLNKIVPKKYQWTINGAFCGYHAYRGFQDFKSHHPAIAAGNAYAAYKSCSAFIRGARAHIHLRHKS